MSTKILCDRCYEEIELTLDKVSTFYQYEYEGFKVNVEPVLTDLCDKCIGHIINESCPYLPDIF